jgi:hypothetical protein
MPPARESLDPLTSLTLYLSKRSRHNPRTPMTLNPKASICQILDALVIGALNNVVRIDR